MEHALNALLGHRTRPVRAAHRVVAPTGRERRLDPDALIVSKTDLSGRITYANPTLVRISDFTERELLGAPHSILRHPEMPRCIFDLLWSRIGQGHEIFAYINNLAKNGDHYWVLAHVTADVDAAGSPVGYHSSRRRPREKALAEIRPLYQTLLAEERAAPDRKVGLDRSRALLARTLADKDVTYDSFVLAL
jgi:PAS domain S-box-containing protein